MIGTHTDGPARLVPDGPGVEPAALACAAGQFMADLACLAATLCDHLLAEDGDLAGPAYLLAAQIGWLADTGADALGATAVRGGQAQWLLSPGVRQSLAVMRQAGHQAQRRAHVQASAQAHVPVDRMPRPGSEDADPTTGNGNAQ